MSLNDDLNESSELLTSTDPGQKKNQQLYGVIQVVSTYLFEACA